MNKRVGKKKIKRLDANMIVAAKEGDLNSIVDILEQDKNRLKRVSARNKDSILHLLIRNFNYSGGYINTIGSFHRGPDNYESLGDDFFDRYPYLLESKDDLKQEYDNHPYLRIESQCPRIKIIKILLNSGFLVRNKNSPGETVLDLARKLTKQHTWRSVTRTDRNYVTARLMLFYLLEKANEKEIEINLENSKHMQKYILSETGRNLDHLPSAINKFLGGKNKIQKVQKLKRLETNVVVSAINGDICAITTILEQDKSKLAGVAARFQDSILHLIVRNFPKSHGTTFNCFNQEKRNKFNKDYPNLQNISPRLALIKLLIDSGFSIRYKNNNNDTVMDLVLKLPIEHEWSYYNYEDSVSILVDFLKEANEKELRENSKNSEHMKEYISSKTGRDLNHLTTEINNFLGGEKYCELVKKNIKRQCKITNDETKNSNECEYRSKTSKCYVLPLRNSKKKLEKTKALKSESTNLKVHKTSDEVTDSQKKNVSPNYFTGNEKKITMEMIKSYKNKYNRDIRDETNITKLHQDLKHIHAKENMFVGHFWIKEMMTNSSPKKENNTMKEDIRIKRKKKTLKYEFKHTSQKPELDLLPEFNETNYTIINVEPDGNCGYNSFIEAMKMNDYNLNIKNVIRDTPDKVRKLLLEYVKDPEIQERIEGGINKKEVDITNWINHEEFEYLAKIFNVCIHIWDTRIATWTYSPNCLKHDLKTCLKQENNIYLYLDEEHFQVLLEKTL